MFDAEIFGELEDYQSLTKYVFNTYSFCKNGCQSSVNKDTVID